MRRYVQGQSATFAPSIGNRPRQVTIVSCPTCKSSVLRYTQTIQLEIFRLISVAFYRGLCAPTFHGGLAYSRKVRCRTHSILSTFALSPDYWTSTQIHTRTPPPS